MGTEARRPPGPGAPRAASALMLLAAFLVGTGCNHRRHYDDVAVEIRLSRKFVRKTMTDTTPDYVVFDALTGSTAPDFEGPPEALIVIVAVLLVYMTVGSVEHALHHMRGTHAHVWPREYKEQYTQRLGWGRNRIWLPRILLGKRVPMVVVFEGNYEGVHELNVDLTEREAPEVKL
jgi:hypothetical protein